MPLYEYECDACGHRFEVIQKFSDPPVAECPKCGGAIRKLQSAPSFQLKGTGWYVTDYPKAGQAPVEKGAGGGSASSSSDTDGAKSDKSDKGDKADKPEKAGAAEKGEKGDTGASTKAAAPSTSTTGTKTP